MIVGHDDVPLHELWSDDLPRLGKIKGGEAGKLKNLGTLRFIADEVSSLRHLEMQAGEKAKGLKAHKDLAPRAESAQKRLDKYIKAEYGTLAPPAVKVWLPYEDPLRVVTYENQQWKRGGTLVCFCDGRICHPLQKDGTREEKECPKDDEGKFHCGCMDKGECQLSIIVRVQLPDMPGGTDGVFHVETKAINLFGAIFHELDSIRGHCGRLMGVDVKLYKRWQKTQYRDPKSGQMRDSWQWIVHLAPWGETLREAVRDKHDAHTPAKVHSTLEAVESVVPPAATPEDAEEIFQQEPETHTEPEDDPEAFDPEEDLGDGAEMPKGLTDADAPPEKASVGAEEGW